MTVLADYEIFPTQAIAERLPYSLKILLENLLRHGDEEGAEAVRDLGREGRALAARSPSRPRAC